MGHQVSNPGHLPIRNSLGWLHSKKHCSRPYTGNGNSPYVSDLWCKGTSISRANYMHNGAQRRLPLPAMTSTSPEPDSSRCYLKANNRNPEPNGRSTRVIRLPMHIAYTCARRSTCQCLGMTHRPIDTTMPQTNALYYHVRCGQQDDPVKCVFSLHSSLRLKNIMSPWIQIVKGNLRGAKCHPFHYISLTS